MCYSSDRLHQVHLHFSYFIASWEMLDPTVSLTSWEQALILDGLRAAMIGESRWDSHKTGQIQFQLLWPH